MFPPFNLGYISLSIIVTFSNACIINSSLYTSSCSNSLLEHIPFNTDEIVTAILVASSYTNGFNPIDSEFNGSIKLYFI